MKTDDFQVSILIFIILQNALNGFTKVFFGLFDMFVTTLAACRWNMNHNERNPNELTNNL